MLDFQPLSLYRQLTREIIVENKVLSASQFCTGGCWDDTFRQPLDVPMRDFRAIDRKFLNLRRVLGLLSCSSTTA